MGGVDDAVHDLIGGDLDGVVDGAAEVAAPPEGVVRGLVRLLVELHALHEVEALELRELVVDMLDGALVELINVRRGVLDALFELFSRMGTLGGLGSVYGSVRFGLGFGSVWRSGRHTAGGCVCMYANPRTQVAMPLGSFLMSSAKTFHLWE